jgi:hypothetical protein
VLQKVLIVVWLCAQDVECNSTRAADCPTPKCPSPWVTPVRRHNSKTAQQHNSKAAYQACFRRCSLWCGCVHRMLSVWQPHSSQLPHAQVPKPNWRNLSGSTTAKPHNKRASGDGCGGGAQDLKIGSPTAAGCPKPGYCSRYATLVKHTEVGQLGVCCRAGGRKCIE